MTDLPDWLAADAVDGVVDPYRLLDLPPGESDPETIRAAAGRLRARLDDPDSGHSDDDRRALRAVLERAEDVLGDPKRKQAYDDLVRSRAAARRARARVRWRGPVQAALRVPKGERWKLAVTAAAACVAVVVGGRTTWRGPEAFPKHLGGVPAVKEADLDSPRLPPPPPKPSVPGLTPGIPRKLRGLEDIKGASEPTLSADLRVLIYSVERGPVGQHDLFITTRDEPWGRFAGPLAMGAVNTPASEHAPSLARDGQELLFVRDGRAFSTSRPNRRERFRTPEPLAVPGVDPDADRVESAQILGDGLAILVRVRKKEAPGGAATPPRYLLAERTAPAGAIERAEAVEVWQPWETNILSADALRDYVATRDGLAVSTRRGLGAKFGFPGLIQRLTPAKVGRVAGPFWVTPQEDVLVFSSPGPEADTKADAPRSLWQVLIR